MRKSSRQQVATQKAQELQKNTKQPHAQPPKPKPSYKGKKKDVYRDSSSEENDGSEEEVECTPTKHSHGQKRKWQHHRSSTSFEEVEVPEEVDTEVEEVEEDGNNGDEEDGEATGQIAPTEHSVSWCSQCVCCPVLNVSKDSENLTNEHRGKVTLVKKTKKWDIRDLLTIFSKCVIVKFVKKYGDAELLTG